jgi:N6-adenosine-specific RNA methylase IME4
MSDQFDLSFHPLAELLPPMQGEELQLLVDDIALRGLRHAIVLYQGSILDGRSRYLACKKLDIEPLTVAYTGNDPLGEVVSVNYRRGHKTESQRAMAAAKLADGAWGGDRRSEFHQVANLRLDQAAKMFGVSERSISSARVVLEAAKAANPPFPKLASAVERGRIRVSPAANLSAKPLDFQEGVIDKLDSIPEMKLTEALRLTHKERLPAKIAALPDGQYRVIYADPPWRYDDARNTGDHRQSTGALDHYNVEGLEKLKELDVQSIAAPDCVLFCWATFPLFEDALKLVEAWGFTYKTAFVWDKGHGSFGNYHDAEAELLIVATCGSNITPDIDKKEKQIQQFARGKHSAKPDEWRQMIDRLYALGPRVILFHRGPCPKGWAVWGAEAADEEQAA